MPTPVHTHLCGIKFLSLMMCTLYAVTIYHPHDSSLHHDLLSNISTYFIQYLFFYPVVHQIRTLSNQGCLASLILGDLECAVLLARGTERLSLFRYVHLKILNNDGLSYVLMGSVSKYRLNISGF